jgi:hypothetical protein
MSGASEFALLAGSADERTFEPVFADGSKAKYRAWDTGSLDAFRASPLGQETIVVLVERQKGRYHGKVIFTLPYGDVNADGLPVLLHTDRVVVDFYVGDFADLNRRLQIMGLVNDFLGGDPLETGSPWSELQLNLKVPY